MSNKKDKRFTITIHMPEGRTDGIIVVRQPNWNGVGIVCPRGRYPDGKNTREEFKRGGVYILIGDNESGDGEMIYVGESDSLVDRLDQHYIKKDFWRKVVIFTRESDTAGLDKADIKYLEFRLLELAKKNKRYDIDNKQSPEKPRLSEEDESTAEAYLHDMLSLLSVINIRAFESVAKLEKGRKVYFYKSRGGEWKASGYATNDNSFVVRKDSIANKDVTRSFPSYSKKTRDKVIEEKILVESENGYRFTQDQEFNSPSEAAAVVRGHAVNGLDEWKDEKGVTLKKNREIEVE